MIKFICTKNIRLKSTKQVLFIKGREYSATKSIDTDNYRFSDFERIPLAELLYFSIPPNTLSKAFKRKDFIFGR